ncbi:reverse transcriptase [Trichonephila clavipes]|nr:reverse transcriptase [Trichonephila clavipes]
MNEFIICHHVGPILKHLERANAVSRFCLTTEHDFLRVYLHWLGLDADEAYPLCGNASMDGDQLIQCTGLDKYMTDDVVNRDWEVRQQMVKKESPVSRFILTLSPQMKEGGKNYPLRYGLAIPQNDHQARRRFIEWAQNEIAVVPDFHKRILFSDEAHFWLNGYVNKQNCRIWSEANPQVYVETPLHPEKLTVWCALWAGGILLQKR